MIILTVSFTDGTYLSLSKGCVEMYVIGAIKMRPLWSNAALRFAQLKTLDKTRTEQISWEFLQKVIGNLRCKMRQNFSSINDC